MKQPLRILTLVIAAIVPPASAQQPAQTKPPVGVPADARQFNGNWYRAYHEKISWKQAAERCRILGGRLGVILDEPTNAFIKQLAEGLPLWLGATDEKAKGVWMWVDGTRMSYKAWAPGQPQGAKKEDYLMFGDGQWYDAFGGEPKVVGFICEWPRK